MVHIPPWFMLVFTIEIKQIVSHSRLFKMLPQDLLILTLYASPTGYTALKQA